MLLCENCASALLLNVVIRKPGRSLADIREIAGTISDSISCMNTVISEKFSELAISRRTVKKINGAYEIVYDSLMRMRFDIHRTKLRW